MILGLQFKLLVSPVGSRSANVGDAVTPGISVRSKRNKRTLSPARKKTSHQLVGSPGSLFQSESGDSNIVASCLSTPKDLQHLKYHNQDMDIHVAMNHITEWTKEVTNTISTLNWTLIGKEISESDKSIFCRQTSNIYFMLKSRHRLLSKC